MSHTAANGHGTPSTAGHDTHGHGAPAGHAAFDVKVLRQDGPGQPSYWERHRIEHQADMNVISVLQAIAAQATTADGDLVAPVAWDCNCLEEVCGACTMVINGRVRQACTALVDRLLEAKADEIVLEPMQKFPVIRDLQVDRARIFRTLEKVHAWIDVDGYYDAGTGPRMSQEEQGVAYPLSECMSCGCCLDACPEFTKIEVIRREGESEADYKSRQNAAYDHGFLGAAAISQAVQFNTHPTGRMQSTVRLDALTAEGGIQHCGNAQNCVAVCPKKIPLTTSIAKAGRAATIHAIKRWFDR